MARFWGVDIGALPRLFRAMVTVLEGVGIVYILVTPLLPATLRSVWPNYIFCNCKGDESH